MANATLPAGGQARALSWPSLTRSPSSWRQPALARVATFSWNSTLADEQSEELVACKIRMPSGPNRLALENDCPCGELSAPFVLRSAFRFSRG